MPQGYLAGVAGQKVQAMGSDYVNKNQVEQVKGVHAHELAHHIPVKGIGEQKHYKGDHPALYPACLENGVVFLIGRMKQAARHFSSP
jgi:hypothetical protein